MATHDTRKRSSVIDGAAGLTPRRIGHLSAESGSPPLADFDNEMGQSLRPALNGMRAPG